MRGVTFDDIHSYDDLGLFMSDRPKIEAPKAKTVTVDIPGGDGFIDLTESLLGEVKYNNRELKFSFMIPAEIDAQAEVYTKVYNTLHGKKKKIILDEDPDYYYIGRCSVETTTNDTVMEIEVTADCEPYKYEHGLRTYTADIASGTEPSLVKITEGDNVSQQYWNTDYRFGTKTIPTYDFSVYQLLQLSWVPSGSANVTIQFVDTNGSIYNETHSQSEGQVEITAETLTEAGIDMTKIYRILFSWGRNAVIYGLTYSCATVDVEGTTKSAVPVFVVEGADAFLNFKGKNYTLNEGTVFDPDVVITEGTNAMMFSGTDATVTIQFQGGYL